MEPSCLDSHYFMKNTWFNISEQLFWRMSESEEFEGNGRNLDAFLKI